MKLQTNKKEKFLPNKENKKKQHLADRFKRIDCQVIYVTRDADLDIVKPATSSSNRCDTVLIEDDTDLLVLLCYHAHTAHPVFFRPESWSNVKKPQKVGISTLAYEGMCVVISCLSVEFLEVTPHRTYLDKGN